MKHPIGERCDAKLPGSARAWHDLMTWVTLQSHDIGDTFVGIYALEKVFGVGRAGAICPRLRGKSVSWLCRCLRVSRKSAYEGLERYGAGGVQAFRDWSHWPDYSQKGRRIESTLRGKQPGNSAASSACANWMLSGCPPLESNRAAWERAPEQTAASPSSYLASLFRRAPSHPPQKCYPRH